VDTGYYEPHAPSWIFDLYGITSGDTIASDTAKRNQLLAEFVPALSKAVGANKCSKLLSDRQFDMPSQFIVNDRWPRDKVDGTETRQWRHSDMGNVAYPYLHSLYDQLTFISNQ